MTWPASQELEVLSAHTHKESHMFMLNRFNQYNSQALSNPATPANSSFTLSSTILDATWGDVYSSNNVVILNGTEPYTVSTDSSYFTSSANNSYILINGSPY